MKASLRSYRIAPKKANLIAKMVRGMTVSQALYTLERTNKKAARVLEALVKSAIANAEHNEGADIDELKVSRTFVDEGPTMKRIQARAKGRANRILKRTSHITVMVADR